MTSPISLNISYGLSAPIFGGKSDFTSLTEPKDILGDIELTRRGPEQSLKVGVGINPSEQIEIGMYGKTTFTPFLADLKDQNAEAIEIAKMGLRGFGFGAEALGMFNKSAVAKAKTVLDDAQKVFDKAKTDLETAQADDYKKLHPFVGGGFGIDFTHFTSAGDKLPTVFGAIGAEDEGYAINSYGAGLPFLDDESNYQSWLLSPQIYAKGGIQYREFRVSGMAGGSLPTFALAPQNGATHQIIDSEDGEVRSIDAKATRGGGFFLGIEAGVSLGKKK